MKIKTINFLTMPSIALAWMAISAALIIVCFFGDPLELNETQVMYLFSTAAQVIGGVFGLMITAYIFLKNELDRQTQDDSTLLDAIEYLKHESHKQVFAIGILTSASILGCLYAISGHGAMHIVAYKFLINIVVAGIVLDVILIIGFSISLISPDNIQDASDEILNSDKFKSDEKAGSLEEFIRIYNLIERSISAFLAPYAPSTSAAPHVNIRSEFAGQILIKENILTQSEFVELKRLVEYRNAVIHGSDPSVNDGMVNVCKRIYETIKGNIDKRGKMTGDNN